MRFMLTLPLLALAALAVAEEFEIHPTIEGTSLRDLSSDKPGWRVDTDRGTVTPLVPGTSLRDYGRSGYNIERRGGRTELQPTIPGTDLPDLSKPGYTIE